MAGGNSHQQWIEISECVNHYLISSEQSNHKFFKCWQLCFRGMQEMGIDFFYTIKSVKLPVNANLTVNLPPDYIKYTKVGVLNAQGEVIHLAYNNNLVNYADLNPNRLQKTQDDTLFNFFFFNSPIFYNYWNGDYFDNLYGIPSGAPFVGDFKMDNAGGVIILGQNFVYNYVILEYIASPREDQNYYIPVQFEEALIAFIAWQDIQYLPNSRRSQVSDKERRRHEFYNQRRLAAARYEPVNLEEAYEWGLRNLRQVVKQ